jgi:copper resistance protein C
MSKMTARAVAALIVILYCSFAYAHAELQATDPKAGATSASPKEIRITFSEAIVPRFSGIELKAQSGKLIATGKSETDPADKKILVVPVNEQLAPGEYRVEWRAVSEDTHRIKGSYSFSVNR